MSGDRLEFDGDQGLSAQGKPVLKFAQSFQKEIQSLKVKNYQLKSARINFITYWKGVDSEREIKIVLPEVVFEKDGGMLGASVLTAKTKQDEMNCNIIAGSFMTKLLIPPGLTVHISILSTIAFHLTVFFMFVQIRKICINTATF